MSVALADAKKLEELSSMVESVQLSASLERFLQSLSLESDEESMVASSLKALPDLAVHTSDLPRSAPNLMSMDWWI